MVVSVRFSVGKVWNYSHKDNDGMSRGYQNLFVISNAAEILKLCRQNQQSRAKFVGSVRVVVRWLQQGCRNFPPLSSDVKSTRPNTPKRNALCQIVYKKRPWDAGVGMSFISHLLRPQLVFGLKNQQKDFCHSHSYSCIGLERAFLSFTLHYISR